MRYIGISVITHVLLYILWAVGGGKALPSPEKLVYEVLFKVVLISSFLTFAEEHLYLEA